MLLQRFVPKFPCLYWQIQFKMFTFENVEVKGISSILQACTWRTNLSLIAKMQKIQF